MSAHHLEVSADDLKGNGDVGRYVLLPGSPGRVDRIAKRLVDVRVVENRRRMNVALGTYVHDGETIDVAAVPTGIGCPSVDIVVNELLQLGARRLLRVGTSGTLVDTVTIGDLVIASAAVRDEATSDAYTPREFPAVADPTMVRMLQDVAMSMGLGERVHCGVVHSKDSFYGREFGEGPDGRRNLAYMERLARSGVLVSEMEAAHLFVLGSVFGSGPTSVSAAHSHQHRVRCGALLGVIGSVEEGIATLEVEEATEDLLVDVALRAMWSLHQLERVRS